MEAYAVDFETYYDDEYSLSDMSVYAYTHHPKFNAYLVGICGPDMEWAGNPKDAPWDLLDGKVLLAHNATFDCSVLRRLVELNLVPARDYSRWEDTADLAVWLQCKRALAAACKVLLDTKVSKQLRGKMKGVTWESACEQGLKEQLTNYALSDARLEYQLYKAYASQWPEKERRVSQLNREAGMRGIPTDVDYLTECINTVEPQHMEALRAMPWTREGEKPLSLDAIRTQARKDGITVPSSLAATSEEAVLWEAKYEHKFPWVAAIRDYRRINAILRRLKGIQSGCMPNGWAAYQCKYFGGHATGRFAGGSDDESGGRNNVQNQYKKEAFGISMRKIFRAPPGKVFVVKDYSQIEARILRWRVKDEAMLKLIRGGMHIYEAHARLYMGWTGGKLKTEDPPKYALAKARELGLGYQCGSSRFKSMAWQQHRIDISEEVAMQQVRDFRLRNPLIVQYWQRHHKFLSWSANHRDPVHEVVLASGRVVRYYDPQYSFKDGSEIIANPRRGDNARKYYGGKLTENEIQGTARDVLVDAWVACEAAGIPILFTVHDELVSIADKGSAAEDLSREMDICLTQSSPWLAGCPLETETLFMEHYSKE